MDFTVWEWEQAGLLSNEELLPTLPPYVQPALIHREGSSKCSDGNRALDNSDQSFDPNLYRQHVNVTQATQSHPNAADHTNTILEEQPGLVGSYSKAEYSRRQASNREHQRRFRLRQKERTQAVEEQLANTQAELQELENGSFNLSCCWRKRTILKMAICRIRRV